MKKVPDPLVIVIAVFGIGSVVTLLTLLAASKDVFRAPPTLQQAGILSATEITAD